MDEVLKRLLAKQQAATEKRSKLLEQRKAFFGDHHFHQNIQRTIFRQ